MPVDLAKAKRAIEMAETGGGRNNWPRVEAAYIPATESPFVAQNSLIRGSGACVNAIVEARWERFAGSDEQLGTAASWGPWQIMYHTAADMGYTGEPSALHKREVCEKYVDKRLEQIVRSGAETIEQVADAWNSGNFRDKIVPADYIAKVKVYYAQA